ncbi:hypothetical protein CYMTET_35504 [Cymbomonas tetramitiformis]|uniref:Pentatricopeptide repeat-containing protein n=1 Tax=Cymbomonas tetramitiformis TaxID=36881 RepID=A0AAE0F903_9CHLO|nr:hypothetical protein CYMTET_35504 [Cymbomonas tetramitiformis]
METRGVSRDRTTFNSVMNACGRAGQTDHTVALYKEMKKKGFMPDVFTFTALATACARGVGLRVSDVVAVEEEMAQREVQPNVHTYTAFIQAYRAVGEWRTAIRVQPSPPLP